MTEQPIHVTIGREREDYGSTVSVTIYPGKTEIEVKDTSSQIEADFDYEHIREIIEEEVGMSPDEKMSGSETGPSTWYDWELYFGSEEDAEESSDSSFDRAKEFVSEIEERLKEEGSTHHVS